jgi:hypothetical protein
MGSVAERLRAYEAVIAAHPENMDLLPGFVDLAFAEARKRTSNLVELPDGETIDIQYLPTRCSRPESPNQSLLAKRSIVCTYKKSNLGEVSFWPGW